MSPAAAEVWAKLEALSPADRDAIAERLLDRAGPVPDPPGEAVGPDEWKAAWHAEIVARLDRFDRGETKAIPMDEMVARMRQAVQDGRK
jgi:putative addiction module component (TIGR02574 family)